MTFVTETKRATCNELQTQFPTVAVFFGLLTKNNIVNATFFDCNCYKNPGIDNLTPIRDALQNYLDKNPGTERRGLFLDTIRALDEAIKKLQKDLANPIKQTALEKASQDAEPYTYTITCCSSLLATAYELYSRANELFEAIIKWFSNTVQNKSTPPEAVQLVGGFFADAHKSAIKDLLIAATDTPTPLP